MEFEDGEIQRRPEDENQHSAARRPVTQRSGESAGDPDGHPVRDAAALEAATVQPGEVGQMPVIVFDQIAQLQQQLQEAQARLQHQRERKNSQQQRWRDRHREHVRQYDRERKRRSSP